MEPVDLAHLDDLTVFLESVETAISAKMNRQSQAVKELLLEGYGNIGVSLKVQDGRLVVADVVIGVTYNLRKERMK